MADRLKKQSKEIKVDKKDIFLSGNDLELHYKYVRELDEFQMMTKNRQLIAELIKPIYDDIQKDRRVFIENDFNMKEIIERVVKLEYLSGVSELKPKIFQEIDNALIDISTKITN